MTVKMKKLESISKKLFENQRVTNSQAAKLVGGCSQTTYTSGSTGWQYYDTKCCETGHITVHFDQPIQK